MRRIIATVGPSLLYRVPIAEVHRPYLIYRVNGAHGTLDEIERHVLEIRRQVPGADILMDLPGNKIRTARLDSPIAFDHGQSFALRTDQTTFPQFHQFLRRGFEILANDGTCRFEVLRADAHEIQLRAHSRGTLLNNKGLHVRGIHAQIPFLFEKDRDLITLANRHRIDYVGLSFVRTADDISIAQELLSTDITPISKIETAAAIRNLDGILECVEHILIDRGDLSSEIGIEKIPSAQDYIMWKAGFYNKHVFLATQLLKNLIEEPLPSIAEVADLYRYLKDGVYGIQLSEETAIGKHPRQCLDFIDRLVHEVSKETHNGSARQPIRRSPWAMNPSSHP